MKMIKSVNFVYTLYEDEDGSFVLDLVIPSATNAWANYEKRVVLNPCEKMLIQLIPYRADRLASKLIAEEKRRQQTSK